MAIFGRHAADSQRALLKGHAADFQAVGMVLLLIEMWLVRSANRPLDK